MHNPTKNPDLPPIWCAFVHLQMHKCTSRSLVEFSPEPVMTRKTGRKKKKKEASRFIANTNWSVHVLLLRIQAYRPRILPNERPIEAAEAEGSEIVTLWRLLETTSSRWKILWTPNFPPLRSVGLNGRKSSEVE